MFSRHAAFQKAPPHRRFRIFGQIVRANKTCSVCTPAPLILVVRALVAACSFNAQACQRHGFPPDRGLAFAASRGSLLGLGVLTADKPEAQYGPKTTHVMVFELKHLKIRGLRALGQQFHQKPLEIRGNGAALKGTSSCWAPAGPKGLIFPTCTPTRW